MDDPNLERSILLPTSDVIAIKAARKRDQLPIREPLLEALKANK